MNSMFYFHFSDEVQEASCRLYKTGPTFWPIHMISIHKVQHVFHNTCYVPTRRYYRRKILRPIPLLAHLETGP